MMAPFIDTGLLSSAGNAPALLENGRFPVFKKGRLQKSADERRATRRVRRDAICNSACPSPSKRGVSTKPDKTFRLSLISRSGEMILTGTRDELNSSSLDARRFKESRKRSRREKGYADKP